MLRNITKREKSLAIATAALLAAALIYNFIIDPVIGQWSDLDKKIRDKEMMLKKYSRILRDKEIIETQKIEYAKYLESKKLTPDEESAALLTTIERTAHAAGVQITNIKPLSYKVFGNYAKFTFRLAAESELAELTRFIYDLHLSDQLLKVERLVLRAKENDPAIIKSILNVTKVSVF